MKKILWLMILIPLFMSKAWASETYYSEYGDFSNYQEQKIEENDMVNVEEVTMYKWYKLIKKSGDYKLYNSTDNFLDDCYETQYSNWSNTKPNINEATILNERTMYEYKLVESVRYIHLYNVSGSYDAFRIPELQILIDGKKLDYSFKCSGCWEGFDKYINNGSYIENESYIDNGGSLIIDLGKEYPINKIKIVFYIFDMGSSDKKYTLGYSKDGINPFINKSYTHQFSSSYIPDAKKLEYTINDLNIDNNLWIKSKTSEQYLDNEYVYNRTSYKQYRYKEKMCKTYTLNKEYYPEYSINAVQDYNLKDCPKTFYRYQKRDKLELYIYDITQKNYDLNNFVLYSSGQYSIDSNINWNKNGIYKVNFKLNQLNVSKEVKLNVISNELKEKEEEINNLKQQLENTISDYDKIIESLEKTNLEYLNSLNDLNVDIIELSKKVEALKDENVEQKDEIIRIESQLNQKIEEYEDKINNLEKLNQKYLENLNILTNNINDLDKKINNLDKSNSSINEEVNNLKAQIQKYIEEYDERIKYLENFNKDYIFKLEQINYSIENINNSFSELKINTEDKYNELSNKIEQNTKSINDIKIIINNNIKEFKDINYQIENLKKQIQEVESNSNNIYDELLTEFNTNKLNITKNIEDLNKQIEYIEIEISDLNNTDKIQNDDIQLLQNKLEENIKVYEKEIISLKEFNSKTLEKIDILNSNINQLETQLNSLNLEEQDNSDNIEKIKIEITNNIQKYNNLIEWLEQFNQDYIISLKTVDNRIKQLYTNLLDIQAINEESIQNLNDKIFQNSIFLEEIEEKNIKNYTEILNNQNSINKNIQDYQNKILDLQELNDKYVLEIGKLRLEIENINKKLEEFKKSNNKQYSNIENYQDLIYNQIITNNEEISKVKQNQVDDNKNIKKLKEDILYVSNKIDTTQTEKSLNTKLNDYVLKINGIEVINLLWIYVFVTIILGVYLVYRFRKKSNKKLF